MVKIYWPDWVMIGGISIIVVSVSQYVLIARQKISLATAHRTGSARQDWCQGAAWFGLLLVTASQAFQEVHRGAPAQSIMLTMAAVTAGAFGCGLCSGRLLARRQRLLETAAEKRFDHREARRDSED